MSNAAVAKLFSEIATALELRGESVFRVRANEKVARILEDLPQEVAGKSLAELMAIEGVGEASARKILEFSESGRMAEHESLWAELPCGLLEVMKVPGLGPKTVKLLWEQAGVTDLASLRAKLAAGSLTGIPRMGEKTLQNIREAIEFMERAGGRARLGHALPMAESIVALLQSTEGAERVEYAGSLRRGRETIGDIDILACGRSAAALAGRFLAMPQIDRVLVRGETKCSVRLAAGVQVDLRVVDRACFGAALLYFTGSKEHNVRLRERALAKGLTLNEYGLFKEDGDPSPPQARGIEPIAAASEEEIFGVLGLEWIPPELREDRGEIAAAAERALPSLIEVADIKAELHAHTTASDGAMTIDELIGEAQRRGVHTIAVTDHSRSSVQANGLSPERLRDHIAAVHAARSRHPGITVLAGSEVDILADGSLDYEDELLALLDIVVASPHSALRQDSAKATERILRAVRHPLVHIIGHPTGRLIGDREGLAPDLPAIAKAAAEAGTALEINANDWRLDLRDTHVKAAVDAGCLLAINCDVHGRSNFDLLRYGVLTGRRGWLSAKGCVNCWSGAALHAWLRRGRDGNAVRVSGRRSAPV